MKPQTPYWLALVAALFLTRTALGAGAQFSADMVVKAEGQTQTMRYYQGNQKIRTELKDEDGQAIISILDMQAKTMITLMPASKTYMEIPGIDESYHIFAGVKPEDIDADDEEYEVKKVGTETVNGYVCDKYVATPRKPGLEKTTTWVATKLGTPIKSVSPSNSMELTNIKEGTQPASLFAVPQGYQKMPGMEELYRGMMQR